MEPVAGSECLGGGHDPADSDHRPDVELRFRHLIDQLPQLVWTTDTEMRCNYCNRQWLTYTGRRPEQEYGDGWMEVIHPDDLDECVRVFRVAFEKREPFETKYRLRRSDGCYRWFLDSGGPCYDIDGEFTGYVGSCVDITERRKATEALRVSEERYRSFVQHSSEGIYLYEYDIPVPVDCSEEEQMARLMSDGHIAACNATFAAMYGFSSPDEVVGMSASDMYVPEGSEVNDALLRRLIRNGYRLTNEISEEQDRNGNPVFFANSGTGIIEDGCLVRLWGTQTDVTEKVLAERQLRASQQSLKEAQRTARLGSWEFCPGEKKQALWSDELKRLWHVASEEEPPATLGEFLALVHPDDRERVADYQQRLGRADETTVTFDLRTNPDNGPLRWLQMTASRRRGPNGSEETVVGTAIDVTERKELELRLAESNAHLKAVLESEPECVKLVGPNGELLDMNPAGLALIEASSREQVLGQCVLDLIASEHRAAFQEMNAAVFRGETRQLEFELRGLKGRRLWMQTHACPLRDADGNVTAQLAVTRNVTERKQAEQELQLNEQRYRSLVKASAGSLWITGPSGGFESPQDSWAAYTGSTWEEYRGYGWTQQLHPDDRERLVAGWKKALADPPELYFVEGRSWNAACGQYRHFEVRAVPIRNADGEVIEWVGSTTDVHQRVTAEAKLRRSQESLARAQEIAHIGSWEYLVQEDVMVWSDELFHIFGLEPGSIELSVDRIRSMIHPDDREAAEVFRLSSDGRRTDGRIQSLEHRIVRPDGSERFVFVQVETEFDESDRPIRATGTVQDITERKRGELLLAGEKQILEMIATGAEQSSVLNHLILLIESQAGNMIGSVLLLDEGGRHLRHGASPSLPEAYRDAIDGAAIGPRARSCGTAAFLNQPVTSVDIATDPLWEDYRSLALDAGLQACWSVPLRSSVGVVMGTLAMYFREPKVPGPEHRRLISGAQHLAAIVLEKTISEEQIRRTQEKLLEQQKHETERVTAELQRLSAELIQKTRLATIGQISAQIAHDLRNPLGAVRNAAYFLKGESAMADGRCAEFLQVIEDEVMTCDTIIRNLLEATRPREPERRLIDAAEMTRVAISRMHTSPDLQVTLRSAPKPFFISFDQVQFRQLMDNLLSNAAQATGRQGTIVADLSRTPEFDLICVTDSGPGIPLKHSEHVFEMLFTTRAKGTGLGLAICRDIVARHGGSIEVQNPGVPGASLLVKIPRTELTTTGPME
ncbi:MAG: PAS domain S-box protein [Fuerstiella sp.]